MSKPDILEMYDELFENYKNMKYRSEILEELRSIEANSPVTQEIYYEGYKDALLWVLWDLNDIELIEIQSKSVPRSVVKGVIGDKD